ncbi:hypothetical protein [Paenibacillus kobensis]|uniref:hypothetical protein n=1 Tax=Paenibacillus kobensis TaxID=59841 RepID=UPI000FD6E6C1|nr:hypothetical protein [Paenibacillus kobensis]
MANQFLDKRLSVHRNDSAGTDFLSTTPLLIGDIGLQTGAAVPTGNAANVRVALTGTVGILNDVAVVDDILLTVERNGNGTAGTGVVILTEAFNTNGAPIAAPFSITAGDFPPAAAVIAGEIRYSLFISATGTGTVPLRGPVVFNGSASAGTT